jgi:hypothetical protein
MTDAIIKRGHLDTNKWRGKTMEDTGRRQLYISQKERPQQKPTLPIHQSQMSSLGNHRKIHFCYLSHLVCGTITMAAMMEWLKW